jgi:hypothetical protein
MQKSFPDFIKSLIPPAYHSLLNKFVLLTIAFCIWVLFFDRANLITQIKLNRTRDELEAQRTYYESSIKEVKEQRRVLFTTDGNFEKFAREKHLMKRGNEEVFIIEEE